MDNACVTALEQCYFDAIFDAVRVQRCQFRMIFDGQDVQSQSLQQIFHIIICLFFAVLNYLGELKHNTIYQLYYPLRSVLSIKLFICYNNFNFWFLQQILPSQSVSFHHSEYLKFAEKIQWSENDGVEQLSYRFMPVFECLAFFLPFLLSV
ncbi:Hypothetical_protein [Hexamita inflata]|uniref:Hypothetical_protein n=1 Tax=Hexamita inflata TaxID=28002 RepID=A0AA86TBX2_9EUKA|nr:Hypothetical protein HINF_LOCUS1275 [Hexamita inflata]